MRGSIFSRIPLFILTLVLALGLVACGSDDDAAVDANAAQDAPLRSSATGGAASQGGSTTQGALSISPEIREGVGERGDVLSGAGLMALS